MIASLNNAPAPNATLKSAHRISPRWPDQDAFMVDYRADSGPPCPGAQVHRDWTVEEKEPPTVRDGDVDDDGWNEGEPKERHAAQPVHVPGPEDAHCGVNDGSIASWQAGWVGSIS